MYEARYFITFSGILFFESKIFYVLAVAMKTREWDAIVSLFLATFLLCSGEVNYYADNFMIVKANFMILVYVAHL